jgi:hypothetical protein
MTSTIGEVLPTAARRFGARTALLVGDRSFSFDDLEALRRLLPDIDDGHR